MRIIVENSHKENTAAKNHDITTAVNITDNINNNKSDEDHLMQPKQIPLFPMHHKLSYAHFMWIFLLGLILFLTMHQLLDQHYLILNQGDMSSSLTTTSTLITHITNNKGKDSNTNKNSTMLLFSILNLFK